MSTAKPTSGADKAAAESSEQYLTFMLAGEEYGVDILRVQENVDAADTKPPPDVCGTVDTVFVKALVTIEEKMGGRFQGHPSRRCGRRRRRVEGLLSGEQCDDAFVYGNAEATGRGGPYEACASSKPVNTFTTLTPISPTA
jgi:hypothetical protein